MKRSTTMRWCVVPVFLRQDGGFDVFVIFKTIADNHRVRGVHQCQNHQQFGFRASIPGPGAWILRDGSALPPNVSADSP